MAPSFAGFYSVNLGLGYSVFCGNCVLRLLTLDDFFRLFFREFRHWVLRSFSFLRMSSALRFSIGHIFSMCAQKKVGWVDAMRGVALVQNMQALWNICYQMRICPSVSRPVFLFAPRRLYGELPISQPGTKATFDPEPASSVGVDAVGLVESFKISLCFAENHDDALPEMGKARRVSKSQR